MKNLNVMNELLETLPILYKDENSTIYEDKTTALEVFNNLDQKTIEKIELFYNLNLENLLNPIQLLNVNGKLSGYVRELKQGYHTFDEVKKLDMNTRIELLLKLKDIFDNLHLNNISFDEIDVNNIITNNNDIYICNVTNASYHKDGIKNLNNDYHVINILTIYLLNDDLRLEDVEDEILLNLQNFFNKIDCEPINGLNDNDRCLNIAYDMIDTKKEENDLFLNHINLEIYKNPTR